MVGIEQVQADAKEKGQKRQNKPRQPALGGVHAYLPLQLEPLANDISDFFQNLGQVSATLFLNQYGRDDNMHVMNGDARRQVQHRLAQFEAKILRIEPFPKLAPNR